jgi:hypothetical protein
MRFCDISHTRFKGTYVYTVIQRAVLGDRDNDGLVVGGRVDRADAVGTSRDAVGHLSRQLPTYGGVVQTLV